MTRPCLPKVTPPIFYIERGRRQISLFSFFLYGEKIKKEHTRHSTLDTRHSTQQKAHKMSSDDDMYHILLLYAMIV